MAEIKRSILFGKLNPIAYKAVESATIFCKMRGNPYVELVHWFNQIFQATDSDLHRIIKYFGLNASRLATDLPTARVSCRAVRPRYPTFRRILKMQSNAGGY